jgi:hypothetical protein
MELHEFVAAVQNFGTLSHQDKIIHFGWYLHVHKNQERFTQSHIRSCFDNRNMGCPNLSQEFKRLVEKRPRVLLQDTGGYRLENGVRQRLDEKYGQHESTIAVSQLLRDLIGKVADEAERHFLSEAITCYHHKAFRAAIIMAWNLAYDHLLRWIVNDSGRLAAFNAQIIARIGQRRGNGLGMAKREDFEELKESEVLDIMGLASLFSSQNVKKMIEIQLTKRNLAAHPSLVVIQGPQADDTITSLVNNVVLAFK